MKYDQLAICVLVLVAIIIVLCTFGAKYFHPEYNQGFKDGYYNHNKTDLACSIQYYNACVDLVIAKDTTANLKHVEMIDRQLWYGEGNYGSTRYKFDSCKFYYVMFSYVSDDLTSDYDWYCYGYIEGYEKWINENDKLIKQQQKENNINSAKQNIDSALEC